MSALCRESWAQYYTKGVQTRFWHTVTRLGNDAGPALVDTVFQWSINSINPFEIKSMKLNEITNNNWHSEAGVWGSVGKPALASNQQSFLYKCDDVI